MRKEGLNAGVTNIRGQNREGNIITINKQAEVYKTATSK